MPCRLKVSYWKRMMFLVMYRAAARASVIDAMLTARAMLDGFISGYADGRPIIKHSVR
jgi:hypothetical protein